MLLCQLRKHHCCPHWACCVVYWMYCDLPSCFLINLWSRRQIFTFVDSTDDCYSYYLWSKCCTDHYFRALTAITLPTKISASIQGGGWVNKPSIIMQLMNTFGPNKHSGPDNRTRCRFPVSIRRYWLCLSWCCKLWLQMTCCCTGFVLRRQVQFCHLLFIPHNKQTM